jgi:hypothetical protein
MAAMSILFSPFSRISPAATAISCKCKHKNLTAAHRSQQALHTCEVVKINFPLMEAMGLAFDVLIIYLVFI